MSVNSALIGNWRKTNTDLRVNSVSTNVSPVISKIMVANTTTLQLSDDYDVWRIQLVGITIDPLATITLIWDGFVNTSVDLVLERNIYRLSSDITQNIGSLETFISPKDGNPSSWDLTLSNVGTGILNKDIYMTIKRVRL